MTLKSVANMHVNCSYSMVWGVAQAASDTCQRPACTAVVDEDGNSWWRCAEHKGWLNSDMEGAVVEEVEVAECLP